MGETHFLILKKTKIIESLIPASHFEINQRGSFFICFDTYCNNVSYKEHLKFGTIVIKARVQ